MAKFHALGIALLTNSYNVCCLFITNFTDTRGTGTIKTTYMQRRVF